MAAGTEAGRNHAERQHRGGLRLGAHGGGERRGDGAAAGLRRGGWAIAKEESTTAGSAAVVAAIIGRLRPGRLLRRT